MTQNQVLAIELITPELFP